MELRMYLNLHKFYEEEGEEEKGGADCHFIMSLSLCYFSRFLIYPKPFFANATGERIIEEGGIWSASILFVVFEIFKIFR
jgi:hypothetical protein